MTKRILHLAGALAAAAFGASVPLTAQDVQAQVPLHGFVRQAETAEPVALALISVGGAPRARSGRDGYFSIPRVSAGEHRLRISALGYATLDTVLVASANPVEIRLRQAPLTLAGITAEATRAGERPLATPEVSVQTLVPAQVRRVPAALEADLFRGIQALPGVVAPSAFSSRMLVRGGAADENQFLLDGYPVIFPYHLGGAFSTFQLEAVKDAELWMAPPPARYGGRLSSVLDVQLREGNRERTTGTASLGIVSSAAAVEGPSARGAWFAGLRTTYLDLVTRLLGPKRQVPYRFFDGYAKTYLDFGPSDRLSVLVFAGRDRAWRAREPGERPEDHDADQSTWGNQVYGLSWRHLLGGRAVFEQRASLSRFTEKLDSGYSALQSAGVVTDNRVALAAVSGILRVDPAGRHQIEAGYSVERRSSRSRIAYIGRQATTPLAERATRSASDLLALYAQDDVTITDAFRVRLGLRGESSAGVRSLQPRVAAKYLLSERVALTAGAGVLRQYDRVIQDPDLILDIITANIWLAGGNAQVPISRSSQWVGGVEVRGSQGLRFRAEAYEKRSSGLVAIAPFQPYTPRFAVERLESAAGRDRGIDLSLAREAEAKVRGWLGYSLAQSARRVGDARFGAEPYPRQRFVAVTDMRLRGAWGLTGRFEAFEGIPFTPAVRMVPERPFDFGTGTFTDQCRAIQVGYLYGSRNSARTGWSKRLDVGAGRRWTDRRNRKWEVSFSILNALFDPTGVFRPAVARRQLGCNAPAKVVRETETVLPPIPSMAVRVEF